MFYYPVRLYLGMHPLRLISQSSSSVEQQCQQTCGIISAWATTTNPPGSDSSNASEGRQRLPGSRQALFSGERPHVEGFRNLGKLNLRLQQAFTQSLSRKSQEAV
jgi:hypothetical protein